jgi:cyclophilin family peptidyl-prolyl cis-trans isomerase
MVSIFALCCCCSRFGWGPHKVEIELAYDPADHDHIGTGSVPPVFFVVELAHIDEMPHASYVFLEQVDRGLYNGAYSFHHNAHHVIQGGAVPNFLSGDADLPERFRESGFASVLFQEYSSNFPHAKYTLGFSGRPGGPTFYISTDDNTVAHGPGGYARDGEADPCFAKIVEGFDAVDHMHTFPVVKFGEYLPMPYPIAVRSMRILK